LGSKGLEHILSQRWFAVNHSDIGGSYRKPNRAFPISR
jgi:hypothetical protein